MMTVASEELLDETHEEETPIEQELRQATAKELGEEARNTVDLIIEKMLIVIDELSGHPLYAYQRPFARRFLESLILGDGATLTALWARQSGKSETISNTIAAVMIMFPVLTKIFPQHLGKFAEGVWVGAFAPVDEQADTLYGRIVARLTSDRALEFMQDPDIQDGVKARGRQLTLRSGSLVRKQTAHPKATIEGRTYHVILIDECQGADERVVNKSIAPMGTATLATKVFVGTPTYHKGVFYDQIQLNKRKQLERGARQNHFEADWRDAGRANPNYLGSIQNELARIGEDSDEFKLAYRLMWLLEVGQFTSAERLQEIGDKSMEIQRSWDRSPVVVGIDPARKADSTIVTVLWVDWDHPDEYGFYPHRILNWLDLGGTTSWEAQYHRIVDFLTHYRVLRIGVDTAGVGDAVADRLRVLMPWTEIVDMPSDRASQSKRWKHLKQLLERGRIIVPAHAKTRQLKVYKRFMQEMEDLQVEFTGPYMLAAAPEKANAHDDYADSLALACMQTTIEQQMPEVEVSHNVFYER
ncbi:hypothetical protein [Nonomuraea typhae]|uniref:Terminase large subunit gp17-like C-terminal domain-containing protein n=1 Tax=Nonomuraea typhae TaxID=2603600 RepID=A0ABW7YJ10_9ACTN